MKHCTSVMLAVTALRSLKHSRRILMVVLLGFGWGHSGVVAIAAPPQMPKTFDRAVVQHLIEALDQGDNTVILKFGYIIRGDDQSLPIQECLILLSGAIAKETPCTRRWYALQSVYGFAELRFDENAAVVALRTYDELFSQSIGADRVGMAGLVDQSVYEFVSLLPRKSVGATKDFKLKAAEVLLQALSSHLDYLKHDRSSTSPMPWGDAALATESTAKCIEVVNKALDDTTFPKTCEIYMTAAALDEATQPKQAIAYLEKAKGLLQEKDGGAPELYKQLIHLLLEQNQIDAAVSAQQELIKFVGHGRADLAALYLKKHDQASFDTVIHDLESPEAGEEDVNQVAVLLLHNYEQDPLSGAKAGQQGETLLTAYLTGRRIRDVEQELQARWTLAHIYLTQKRLEKAKATLSVEYPSDQITTSRSRRYYAAIRRLFQRINEVTAGGVDTKTKEKRP